ncbi:DUF106 domain-containing protein [Candidatus Woesearchaeota archaeon]|nr:DUF106 domain-containing protein [Candidatus Woesearchaeota archaeon]
MGFGDSLLNKLLPLIDSVGIFWFVVIVSFAVSLLTVVIYKFATNQMMMKSLREELKKMQAEIKKHSGNPQKMMQLNKEMMSKNMKLMSHSMKPTIITMIPLLILFVWLNTTLTYAPLTEDVQFIVTVNFDDYVGNAELLVPKGMTIVDDAMKEIQSKVDWRLSGKPGEYLLEWKVGDKSYTKDVVIANGQKYAEKTKNINDGVVKSIDINYKKNVVLPFWPYWGWLGTYILFSLVFSIFLRKLLKVY